MKHSKWFKSHNAILFGNMTRDDDDLGNAIGGGIIGAFVGYGIAKPTIENLKATIQIKDQKIAGLLEENRMKDYTIAQLQAEIKKLKEQKEKGKRFF